MLFKCNLSEDDFLSVSKMGENSLLFEIIIKRKAAEFEDIIVLGEEETKKIKEFINGVEL